MAQTQYCAEGDLLRAYGQVFSEYKPTRIISGYKSHSSTVFKIAGTGYVDVMYEDNVKMTAVATLVNVDSVGDFFYDSTNDILYFYATGSVPDVHTYKIGTNVVTAVTDAIETASSDAESMLDQKFPVPIPQSPDGTTDKPFDAAFVRAVALIACSHILARNIPAEWEADGKPANTTAQLRFDGEKTIKEYVDGTRVFSWEITSDEVGGHNIRPASTNTSAGIIQLRGKYDPDYDDDELESVFDDETTFNASIPEPFWKVKITTAGVLGVAKFQVSLDNGTTYSGDEVLTSNQWMYISDGVWIRFLTYGAASAYVKDDTWQIEISNPQRDVTSAKIKSRPINLL